LWIRIQNIDNMKRVEHNLGGETTVEGGSTLNNYLERKKTSKLSTPSTDSLPSINKMGHRSDYMNGSSNDECEDEDSSSYSNNRFFEKMMHQFDTIRTKIRKTETVPKIERIADSSTQTEVNWDELLSEDTKQYIKTLKHEIDNLSSTCTTIKSNSRHEYDSKLSRLRKFHDEQYRNIRDDCEEKKQREIVSVDSRVQNEVDKERYILRAQMEQGKVDICVFIKNYLRSEFKPYFDKMKEANTKLISLGKRLLDTSTDTIAKSDFNNNQIPLETFLFNEKVKYIEKVILSKNLDSTKVDRSIQIDMESLAIEQSILEKRLKSHFKTVEIQVRSVCDSTASQTIEYTNVNVVNHIENDDISREDEIISLQALSSKTQLINLASTEILNERKPIQNNSQSMISNSVVDVPKRRHSKPQVISNTNVRSEGETISSPLEKKQNSHNRPNSKMVTKPTKIEASPSAEFNNFEEHTPKHVSPLDSLPKVIRSPIIEHMVSSTPEEQILGKKKSKRFKDHSMVSEVTPQEKHNSQNSQQQNVFRVLVSDVKNSTKTSILEQPNKLSTFTTFTKSLTNSLDLTELKKTHAKKLTNRTAHTHHSPRSRRTKFLKLPMLEMPTQEQLSSLPTELELLEPLEPIISMSPPKKDGFQKQPKQTTSNFITVKSLPKVDPLLRHRYYMYMDADMTQLKTGRIGFSMDDQLVPSMRDIFPTSTLDPVHHHSKFTMNQPPHSNVTHTLFPETISGGSRSSRNQTSYSDSIEDDYKKMFKFVYSIKDSHKRKEGVFKTHISSLESKLNEIILENNKLRETVSNLKEEHLQLTKTSIGFSAELKEEQVVP